MINRTLVLEIFHERPNRSLADDGIAVCKQRDLEQDPSRPLLASGYHAIIQCLPELVFEKLEPLGMANRIKSTAALSPMERDVGTLLIKPPPPY